MKLAELLPSTYLKKEDFPTSSSCMNHRKKKKNRKHNKHNRKYT
jgi:hypothetical protein